MNQTYMDVVSRMPKHTTMSEFKCSINEARAIIADSIGATPEEIFFTSGGTQSNSLAFLATVKACGLTIPHVITTTIEDSESLKTILESQDKEVEVTLLTALLNHLQVLEHSHLQTESYSIQMLPMVSEECHTILIEAT